MNKLLSTLFIVCISFSINAQKCKFDYNKKDPFTGKSTKGISATLDKSWMIGFNKNDNNYSIGLVINFPGVKEDIINKGDTLMIAIENSEPIILTALEKSLPNSNVVGGGTYKRIQSSYRANYIITSKQMQLLSLKNMIAIRIYFSTKWFSLDIPIKNSKKIKQATTCILK